MKSVMIWLLYTPKNIYLNWRQGRTKGDVGGAATPTFNKVIISLGKSTLLQMKLKGNLLFGKLW